MDISSILSGGKTSSKDYYWALVIESGWIAAGIWEIEGEAAKVVALSPPAAWKVDEELIGAADAALSAAIQKLPEDIGEPSKTVFGVPSSWVSDGQIKSEHLEKIKRVCSELSLEPTGFVVLPEAIAHLFKSEEGTPLNAVVIGLGEENLDIAVFRLGNLAGNALVARSVSIADDVAEGLTRFAGTETLPSRLLLYDGKEGELEEVKQTLLKTSWEENEKIKFLHTPKIEIVDPEKKILATALAGASEIANVSTIKEEKGKFAEAEEEALPEETQNVEEPQEKVSAEDLGFVVGEDVAKKGAPEPEMPQRPAVPRMPAAPGVSFLAGFFNRVKESISGWLTRPTSAPAGTSPNKNILMTGAIALGVILVVGFILWWYLPRATVTIYVSPKNIEESVAATFDTNISSSDIGKDTLAAKVVETDVSGEKTKSTTGRKVVGEKAKGSVKIQNGTASIINLASGTVLVGAGDLTFSLNSAASVSAALSPSEPGTATVDVTATDIGNQYNLAKDETFKVGNYPKADVDATAVGDFTGGTSRDISAVAEEDTQALEEDLTDELLENAKEKLKEGAGSETIFVPEAVSSTPTAKTFSNKVGDEASTLKLSLELTVTGITVDKNSLYELGRQALKEKTPSGFALRDDQLSFRFELTDENKGIYDIEVTASANLLPELKIDEIKKNIVGRKPKVAENYLTSIPGFTRAEIKISPTLPAGLKVLPRMAKRIDIQISAER